MADENDAKTLNRDAILNAADIKYEDVDTPEWGGITRVRMLTAKDKSALEYWSYKNIDSEKVIELYPRVCIACIVDENGNRIFQDDDLESLMQKNGTVLGRVADVAMKLNKMSPDDVEEAAKN
jgi:hypothetical protein